MDIKNTAKQIVELVGGEANIESLTHCVTRLRFQLKDNNIAQTEKIKEVEGVITVMVSAGQYQVVVGNIVTKVYKEIIDNNNITVQDTVQKKKLFDAFVDMISGVFAPSLGVLSASGMIKGFLAMFVAFGWMKDTSGEYQLLFALGDAMFTYLPVVLGYSAMKKFGGSPYLGILFGAILTYPAITTMSFAKPVYVLFEGTIAASNVATSFFGIPVIIPMGGYVSTVIPIIVITYFGAKAEKFFSKVIPDVISLFIVPLLTIVLVGTVGFLVIGPITSILSSLLGNGATWLAEVSPPIYGFILGGFWQVFVMFGLHWGLIPLYLNNLAELNVDTIIAPMFAASFAQIGAVAAVYFKTNNSKTKSVAIPAFVAGIFGVTEASIYGVTLPLKKPFIISCVVAAFMGAYLQVSKAFIYNAAGMGVFAIPGLINKDGSDGVVAALISIPIAFIAAFVLTYFFGMDSKHTVKKSDDSIETASGEVTLVAPVKGDVIKIEDVNDQVFASKTMGDGIAIYPHDNTVVAPLGGSITALFPTNHAIGITCDNGVELLVHIGINTVELNGEGFKAFIKEGDRVSAGQKIVEIDNKLIQEKGFDPTVMIIITNANNHKINFTTNNEVVNSNDKLLVLA